MVLEKNRPTNDVLFIDASKGFEKQKSSNKLRQEDVDKIVSTYLDRKDVEKYAHVASMDEIEENEFNLNIPRYVDTFEEEPPVDIDKLSHEMKETDKQIDQLESEIGGMLDDLVGATPDAQAQLTQLKELFYK